MQEYGPPKPGFKNTEIKHWCWHPGVRSGITHMHVFLSCNSFIVELLSIQIYYHNQLRLVITDYNVIIFKLSLVCVYRRISHTAPIFQGKNRAFFRISVLKAEMEQILMLTNRNRCAVKTSMSY